MSQLAILHISNADGRLYVEPAAQITDDLRQWIKANKALLLESAPCVEVFTDEPESLADYLHWPTWMDELATILKCEPSYLLESGAIDCHDLIEQDGSNPQAMADLIRSNPAWVPQLNWKAIGRQYAAATTFTAAVAEPEWPLARDAYHNHWAACLDCHPPVDRYCTTGAALKARYEAVTDQEREQTA